MPVRNAAEVKVIAVQKTAILILLAYCSKEDIKTKQIPVIPVAVFAVIGFFWNLLSEEKSVRQILAGASIGVIMLAISILSHEKVGKGDALILGCVGIYFGFYSTLFMWWGSSVLLAVFGISMIAAGKLPGRKAKLPYVPFLLFTYMVVCLPG